MTTLPELVLKATELTNKILEAGGELTPALEMELVVSERELAQKTDSYAAVIKRLEMEEEFWKKEEDKIKKIRYGYETAVTRMKNSIKSAMRALQTNSLEGENAKFTLYPTKPKLIMDESILDAKYSIVVTEHIPDEPRIIEMLESGEPVVGAKLESRYGLRIGVKR
jgi:hypothetical protein